MRELFRIGVTIMLTLLGLVILWRFGSILGLYILAVFVDVTLRPGVEWLRKLNIPAGVSVLLIYAVILALLVGMAILAFPLLSHEVQQFLANFNLAYRTLYEQVTQNSNLTGPVQGNLPPPASFPTILPGIDRQQITTFLVGTTIGFVEGASQLLLIAFLGLYLSIDHIRFERLMLSVVSPLQRTAARQVYHEIEESLGSYIRSELIQSAIAGLILYVLYLLIGLRYPLLSALIVSITWVIPLVGGLIGLAWVALAGIMTQGTVLLTALLVTGALFFFLEFWLQPRLYQRDRFGVILILLIMMVLGRAYGVLGLLVAPPLATAIQVLINGLLRTPGTTAGAVVEASDRPAEQVVADEWQELEHQLENLRLEIEQKEVPPSTHSLYQRLVKLVEKSKAELASDNVGLRES